VGAVVADQVRREALAGADIVGGDGVRALHDVKLVSTSPLG
jgi:hypothetical protein